MINLLERQTLLKLSIILVNLKPLDSYNLTVNIRDLCQLSNERFPDKNHNVSEILLTYDNCLEKINDYPGTIREILLNQLMDRLECFKEDVKHLYYAGNVEYYDVEQVESMETDLHNKGLQSTLQNWHGSKCDFARSIRSTVRHIIPLLVTGTNLERQKACEAIFKQQNGGNTTQGDIPTPKLDNNKDPKQLTVPLACLSTYKVDSPEAENALTQYYTVVMKCLTLSTEHKIQVFRFNKKFYNWLTQAVLPHLKEDKCYPAFAGVLRIVETMRQNDYVPKNATANFIFYRQKGMGKKEEERRNKEDNISKLTSSVFFPMILGPWVLFIVLLICFLWKKIFCCGSNKTNDTDSTTTEIFYYPIEATPSVSLDLDDVSLEPAYSERSESDSKLNLRQRGGDDQNVYSMYQQDDTLMGLPVKRQWPCKGSSMSHSGTSSPGKRQKKMIE